MEATTRDLRLHTKALIAATDRGEEVVITFRGRPRAVLAPLERSNAARDGRNPAFGIWASRAEHDDVDGQVRKLRERRALP